VIDKCQQPKTKPTDQLFFLKNLVRIKKVLTFVALSLKKRGAKKSANRYTSPAIELEVKDDGSIIFFKANKQTKENRGKKMISTPVV